MMFYWVGVFIDIGSFSIYLWMNTSKFEDYFMAFMIISLVSLTIKLLMLTPFCNNFGHFFEIITGKSKLNYELSEHDYTGKRSKS